MPLPVERWIVCVTGFTQDDGRITGIDKIEDAIHHQCNGPSTRVLLKSWRDDASALAERIWNRRPSGHPPAVVLIGYSYGGYTATLIAAELKKRGIPVEKMQLIDAVWRPYERTPSLLSLISWWSIDVPDTVGELWSFMQRINKPAGHRLNVSKKTSHFKHTLKVTHQYADDDEDVLMTALKISCPNQKEQE